MDFMMSLGSLSDSQKESTSFGRLLREAQSAFEAGTPTRPKPM